MRPFLALVGRVGKEGGEEKKGYEGTPTCAFFGGGHEVIAAERPRDGEQEA